MIEGTWNWKETCAVSLREIFESNICMIEKTVWQDEKNFTVEVPVSLQNNRVYGKEKKSDIPDENLLSLTNNMSKKAVVLTVVSWCSVIKPFVNNNGISTSKECYCWHLHKELFPAIEKVVIRDDWIFAQDWVPSHQSHSV